MALDQLEKFFVVETHKLIEAYEVMRKNDPRNGPLTDPNLTIDQEMEIVKNTWALLILYAQRYGYERFNRLPLSLEQFYMENIQDV